METINSNWGTFCKITALKIYQCEEKQGKLRNCLGLKETELAWQLNRMYDSGLNPELEKIKIKLL